MLLAEVPQEDLRAVTTLRSRYGSLTVVQIDRSAWDPSAAPGPSPGGALLRVTRDAPFADTWNAYVRSLARGRGSGRMQVVR